MLIVGVGGTTRLGSSSERALRVALEVPEAHGCEVHYFTAGDLDLPMYDPRVPDRTDAAQALLSALRRADGVIVSSPGYHGTISGLLKNAFDYLEDFAAETPQYLDGRAVGCIAVAHGWQAAVSTLGHLRDVVHALRAWPTPYGAAINVRETPLVDGSDIEDGLRSVLHLVGRQVLEFAYSRQSGRAPMLRAMMR